MIDKLLVKTGIFCGNLVYAGFEHFTKHTQETQEKLLKNLIKKNKNTEYGKKAGFAEIKSVEDYQKKVPLTDYSDYSDYVQRMIKGERNLITSARIRRYVETSGSSGTPKVVPMSPKAVFNVQCMGFVGPEACIHKYYKRNGKKMSCSKGLMSWIVMSRRFPNGEHVCDGASIPISILKPITNLYSAIPKELIFAKDPANTDINYLLLRFGLPYKKVSYIGAVIITSSVSMFQYLEKNWRMICDDIETGKINDGITVDSELKRILEKKLKPSPARASELRAEFEKGFDDPIAPRIWPELSWVYGMASSTLSAYGQRIRRYIGDLPLHNFGYGASEGYFAMPVEPDVDEAVMLPKSNFFEFVPVDGDRDSTPLLMHQLEAGKDYEVILTNLSGFYRYRLGDVIKVTGFYHTAPKVRFLYRSNVTVNVSDEKTTQQMLDETMKRVSERLGLTVLSYGVHGNTTDRVAHYTLLVETDVDPDDKLRDEIAAVFDEELCKINVEYDRYRKNETLDTAQAHFIRVGTFDDYKNMLRAKGRDVNQLKPVTIINTDEKQDFFFSHIIL